VIGLEMMDRCALPPALPGLVETYAGRQPEAVRYRAPFRESALADVPGRPTRLLVNPAVTAASAQPRYRAVGDRVITADAVAAAGLSPGQHRRSASTPG